MKLSNRLLIEIAATGSLSLGAFLYGIYITGSRYLPPFLFASVVAGGSVAAVCTIRDRTGELKYEISGLKGEIERFKAKAEEEYEDSAAVLKELETIGLKLQQTELALQNAIREKDHYFIAAANAANDKAEAEGRLTAHVREVQAYAGRLSKELQDTQEQLEQRDRKEIHIAVKQKGTKIASRLYANYQKALEADRAEMKADAEQQIARYQSRVDELSREVERLTEALQNADSEFGEVEKTIDEASSLFREKTQADRDGFKASYEDLARMYAMAQQEIVNLKLPKLFTGNTEAVKRANKIISYLWEVQEYRCDRVEIREGEGTDEIWLYFDNLTEHSANYKQVLESEYVKNDIQAELRLKTQPKFKFDPDRWMLSCTVQHGSKKAVDKDTLSRLLTPSEKFFSIAGKWQRVRVTGGSQSGKSPVTELIAYAMLKARLGSVALSNPKAGSRKDRWSVRAINRTHEECFEAIQDLSSKVAQNATFIDNTVHIFDETDGTIKQHKEAAEYFLTLLKEASHNDLRFIIAGQNANASNYKIQRSDLQNVVSVHLGNNAIHAIENSDLTNEEKNKWKERISKVAAEIAAKNQEAGWTNDDKEEFKFALVDDPKSSIFLIQLPALGEYHIADLLSENTGVASRSASRSSAVSSNLQPQSAASQSLEALENREVAAAAAEKTATVCPSCQSNRLKKNGMKQGNQRYQCKNCGKNFVDINSSN